MGTDYVIRKVAVVSWSRQRPTRWSRCFLGGKSLTKRAIIYTFTTQIDCKYWPREPDELQGPSRTTRHLHQFCIWSECVGHEGHTWPTERIRHMLPTTHRFTINNWVGGCIYLKATLSLSRRPLLLRGNQGFAGKLIDQPSTLSIWFPLDRSCPRGWHTCHTLGQMWPLHHDN